MSELSVREDRFGCLAGAWNVHDEWPTVSYKVMHNKQAFSTFLNFYYLTSHAHCEFYPL